MTDDEPEPQLFWPPWKIRDALVIFALAWIGLPIAILILTSRLSLVIPALRPLVTAFKNGDITASFIFTVVDTVAAFGLVMFYLHKYGAKLRDLGFRRFNVKRALLYLAVAIVAFIVLVPLTFYLVGLIFPAFNADQAQTNDFTAPTSTQARNLSLIALVLLPPLVEEMVFRGFMFPALAKRIGPIWGAVVTSLLFGLAHLQYNVGVYTVMLGLLLCFLYYRTRSIIPGILLHMLNNYLAFVVLTGK